MALTQTCRTCGEVKPLTAYRYTRHGKPRPTCKGCDAAAAKAKRLADPERLARHREQQRRAAAKAYAAKAPARAEATTARRVLRLAAMTEAERERAAAQAAARKLDAARAAARAADAASLATEAEAVERRISESGILTGKSRVERERILKDAVWDTMRHHRAVREERIATATPDASHRLKLKGGRGFISIAEMACRVAEREACYSAGKARKLLPAACDTIALLERDTSGADRTRSFLSYRVDRKAPEPKQGVTQGDPEEAEQFSPFADAFGDWAPAWMNPARGSWTASLPA